jgi:hypothetical protein
MPVTRQKAYNAGWRVLYDLFALPCVHVRYVSAGIFGDGVVCLSTLTQLRVCSKDIDLF